MRREGDLFSEIFKACQSVPDALRRYLPCDVVNVSGQRSKSTFVKFVGIGRAEKVCIPR